MLLVSLLALMLVVVACGEESTDPSLVLQLKYGPVSEDELREYLRSRPDDGAPSEDLIRLCGLSRAGAEDAEVADRVADLLDGDGTGNAVLNTADIQVAADIVAEECAPLFRF